MEITVEKMREFNNDSIALSDEEMIEKYGEEFIAAATDILILASNSRKALQVDIDTAPVPVNLPYSEKINGMVVGDLARAADVNAGFSQLISDIKLVVDGNKTVGKAATADGLGGKSIDLSKLVNGDGLMYNGTSGKFETVALFNGVLSTWKASTAVDRADLCIPTSGAGNFFEAQNTAKTGAKEPVWPTAIGGTVIDGGVTWKLVIALKTAGRVAYADEAGIAQALKTARKISIGGGKIVGTATSFDGSADIVINATSVIADSCVGNSATATLATSAKWS